MKENRTENHNSDYLSVFVKRNIRTKGIDWNTIHNFRKIHYVKFQICANLSHCQLTYPAYPAYWISIFRNLLFFFSFWCPFVYPPTACNRSPSLISNAIRSVIDRQWMYSIQMTTRLNSMTSIHCVRYRYTVEVLLTFVSSVLGLHWYKQWKQKEGKKWVLMQLKCAYRWPNQK